MNQTYFERAEELERKNNRRSGNGGRVKIRTRNEQMGG
jgi:hypothetical protein